MEDYEDFENGEEENAERIAPEGQDYVNITELTDEQINQWNYDDPKSFAANSLKQTRAELLDDAVSKEEENETLDTYNKYAESTPDFDSMWDRGEIQEFMEKHPGHNAISAHMALTRERQGHQPAGQSEKDEISRLVRNVKARREG